MIGDKNPSWKGGVVISGNGYIYERAEGHPRATKKGKYVFQHVLVYERKNKCCILPWGKIHHIDANKQNNSIENLFLTSQSYHASFENKKDMSDRKCYRCGSDKTWVDKRGYAFWRIKNNHFICNTCYCKYFRTPDIYADNGEILSAKDGEVEHHST